MIIVAGTMIYDPADLPDFAAAVRAMIETVRAEDGCLHYALLIDETVPGTVNAFEIWHDEAALRAHLATPWIADFFGKFGPKTKSRDIKIYDVANVRPMSL